MLKVTYYNESELPHSSTREDLGLEVIKNIQAENVLLLCPHPDDETFGCGGLLKILSKAGAKIKAIYFVNGAIGNKEGIKDYELAKEREEEVFEAMKVLGIHEVNFLRIDDEKMAFREELAQYIYEELKIRKYDLVLVPDKDDWNSDHRALSLILQTALKKLKSNQPAVFEYFIWGLSTPNLLLPIDGVLEYKKEAIRCHKSQLKVKPYDEAFLAVNEFLGKGFCVSKYAEAYRQITE